MNSDNSRYTNIESGRKKVLVVDDELLSRVRSKSDERVAEVIVSDGGSTALHTGEPVTVLRLPRTREFRRRAEERAVNIARIRRENKRGKKYGVPQAAAPQEHIEKPQRIFEQDILEITDTDTNTDVSTAAETYARGVRQEGYSFAQAPKTAAVTAPQSFSRHRRDEAAGTGGASGGYRRRYGWATGVAVGAAAAVLIAVPLVLLGTTNTRAVALSDYLPSPSPAAAVEEAVALDTTAAERGAQEAAMMAAAQEALPSPSPTPEPIEISVGYTGPEVVAIQTGLMDLGYMMSDEPTEYYGLLTQESVAKFQDKNGLAPNGIVDNETYDLLMNGGGVYYSISLGAESTDVYELQVRLRELAYLDKATSYFGEETQAAVMKFQQKNGIDADGSVGEATREKLYSEDVVANSLQAGDSGDEIKTYQTRLKKLGYLTTTPDGKFGNDTVMAVRRFQERNGLIADGYIGPSTKTLLMSDDAVSNSLQIGDKGDDVIKVQNRLKDLRYLSGDSDGYFGEKTDGAVRSFQKLNSLSVDGKVGSKTMNTLMSSDAKKYTATAAKPSSGSSSGGSSSGSTPAKVPETSGASVSSLIAMAESRLGCPYVLGAKGADTFDCSGLVYWCLNQIGVSQSYMTSYTWRSVTRYERIESMSQIKAGDIIVYHSNGLSSTKGHVGIAVSSSQMIDASSANGKVMRRSFQSSYWQEHFVCAYRIF